MSVIISQRSEPFDLFNHVRGYLQTNWFLTTTNGCGLPDPRGRALVGTVTAVCTLYLEDSLVAQQQVGRLQIAMQNPVVVEMSDTSQQLNHQRLYFA